MRFRPSEAFPLTTTKNLGGKAWKALRAELLWFLSGSTHIRDLHLNDVHLWDQWATKEICDRYGLPEGDLGRIYGKQWRSWRVSETELVDDIAEMLQRGAPNNIILNAIETHRRKSPRTIDQISNLIQEIKERPDSKRMMVVSWNPEDIDSVMVAPCHGIFKVNVAEGVADLVMFQRSADLPIGVPFNIASYSLLLLMIAQVTNLMPGELIYEPADVHIYYDQIEGMKTILKRAPRQLPRATLNPSITNLFNFRIDDIELRDYDPHPHIKIPVAL